MASNPEIIEICGNNGVIVMVSRRGYEAACELQGMSKQDPRYAEIHEVLVKNTYTFVRDEEAFERYYRGLGVTGTAAHFEKWTRRGRCLVFSRYCFVYVPFSNGPKPEDEPYRRTAEEVIEAFGRPAARPPPSASP